MFTMLAPVFVVAEATAPATVFGMSWNLRSKKISFSQLPEGFNRGGAGCGEELSPDLEQFYKVAELAYELIRRSEVVDIERYD